MNDKEREILLLQIIRVNGNTMYLLKQGMSLPEIKKQIDLLVRRGIVMRKDNMLSLTKGGEQYLYEINHQMGRKGLYRYYSPDYVARNIPEPVDKVYIPPLKRKKGAGK